MVRCSYEMMLRYQSSKSQVVPWVTVEFVWDQRWCNMLMQWRCPCLIAANLPITADFVLLCLSVMAGIAYHGRLFRVRSTWRIPLG